MGAPGQHAVPCGGVRVIDWMIDHTPSARHLFVFNALHFLVWLLLMVPSVTVWRVSTEWIVFMSAWALVVGSFGSTMATLAQLAAEGP